MFARLRPLLVVCCCCCLQLPGGRASTSGFLYQDINTGNGNGDGACVRAGFFFITGNREKSGNGKKTRS